MYLKFNCLYIKIQMLKKYTNALYKLVKYEKM